MYKWVSFVATCVTDDKSDDPQMMATNNDNKYKYACLLYVVCCDMLK